MDAGGKDGTIKHVFSGAQSAGRARRELQAADAGRSRARFPVARPSARPGTRRNRDLQPFALRGRAGHAGPQAHRQGDLDAALPGDSRFRGAAGRRTEPRSSSSSCTSARKSSSRASPSASRIPSRNWKISEADYTEREFWDDYIEAFEDAIRATSTHEAPWYVIPSNAKWFRNLAVSQIIADAMADLDLAYPPPSVNLAEIRRKYHAAAERSRRRREEGLIRARRPISIKSPPMIWRARRGLARRTATRADDRRARGTEALSVWRYARERVSAFLNAPSNTLLRRLLARSGLRHWKGYRLRLRDDGPDRGDDRALRLDHRADRRPGSSSAAT